MPARTTMGDFSRAGPPERVNLVQSGGDSMRVSGARDIGSIPIEATSHLLSFSAFSERFLRLVGIGFCFSILANQVVFETVNLRILLV
jgi:hypothetical protein